MKANVMIVSGCLYLQGLRIGESLNDSLYVCLRVGLLNFFDFP